MKAQDVYTIALCMIDSDGDDERANRTPQIIDVLSKELAFYEGTPVTKEIKTLDDELYISDDTATRVLPYGVAASFALADKDGDMYNDYSYMYRALCRTIKQPTSEEIQM